jgi:hypothetical protein
LQLVYNIDEKNVFFSQKPVNLFKARTVSNEETDSSQRCTVMVGGSSTGEILLPFMILKGANTCTRTF